MTTLKQFLKGRKLDQFIAEREMNRATRKPSIARFRQWPESRKQFRKHRLRAIPTIEAKLGFHVFVHMLARYVNMRSVDSAL